MNELVRLTACDAVRALKRREVSPADLIAAAFERIDAVDGAVNAMVIRCRERAETRAAQAPPDSLLAGLPVAVKDLTEVAGVRCTFGSPIYTDYVPDFTDLPAANLEAAGGVVIGKTNTPEFGAGANTFNPVFGATRNPWDTSKSCAGSSGGSAVALATGQAWLATGSDLGGSLRTPAGFCGIVGLRPTPGRVPRLSVTDPFGSLSVEGPMARTAADAALLLDAMAGTDPRDPIAVPPPPEGFLAQCEAAPPPRRIAYSPDLGGIVPIDPAVRRVFEEALALLEGMGVEVVPRCPDFSGAIETFKVLRGLGFVNAHRTHYRDHRDKLKADVIWNIEYGQALDVDTIAKALQDRAAIRSEAVALTREAGFDAFLCPTAIVPPYPVEQPWVDRVGETVFEDYIHWLAPVSAITLTGLPAVSVPAGLTEDGLPVGVQFVGAPRGEGALLGLARHFEEAAGLAGRVPLDPIVPGNA